MKNKKNLTTDKKVIKTKRYYDLDALRSVAMFLGIILHSTMSFCPDIPGNYPQDIHQHQSYMVILEVIHGFRMPLFFLISGFFTTMTWKRYGLTGLLIRRSKRILLPMIIFGIFVIPFCFALAEWANSTAKQANGNSDVFIAVKEGDLKAFKELLIKKIVDISPTLAKEVIQSQEIENWRANLTRFPNYVFDFLEWIWLISVLPTFHYLWFLNYLFWLILIFAALIGVMTRFDIKRPDNKWLITPLCLIWLVPLTFIFQCTMFTIFGPDTYAGLIPWPPVLIYYGIFFGFGALCYGQQLFEKKTGEYWLVYLAVSVLSFLISVYFIEVRSNTGLSPTERIKGHIVVSFCTTLYTWSVVFGMVGLFRRFFSHKNRTIRYLSDSSYWLYLAHLPVIMSLQILASTWNLPSLYKFLGICLITSASLLIVYELAIRYSWVGSILNGQKYR